MVTKKKATKKVAKKKTTLKPIPAGEYTAKISGVSVRNGKTLSISMDTSSASMQAEEKPLLHRAHDIIHGQRQQDYGDTLQNFAHIAMFWQATLATKLAPGQKISPEDVALCMMQVKVARLAKSPKHQDSILDAAGYIGCYDKLQKERWNGAKFLGAIEERF
jgi:hypothetical protein